MKHTECEDCKLRNGDCGYHFKMDGKTNYDIPSLTACDRYGNCEFFRQKEQPTGDLISREALKNSIGLGGLQLRMDILDLIDNAPTVEARPKGEWIFAYDDKADNSFVYKCSECGREVSVYSSDALIPVYPFCHCGADMRKGGEDK